MNLLKKNGKINSYNIKKYNKIIRDSNIKLVMNITYEYTNMRKANAFANKFKKLANRRDVEININFIRI